MQNGFTNPYQYSNIVCHSLQFSLLDSTCCSLQRLTTQEYSTKNKWPKYCKSKTHETNDATDGDDLLSKLFYTEIVNQFCSNSFTQSIYLQTFYLSNRLSFYLTLSLVRCQLVGFFFSHLLPLQNFYLFFNYLFVSPFRKVSSFSPFLLFSFFDLFLLHKWYEMKRKNISNWN